MVSRLLEGLCFGEGILSIVGLGGGTGLSSVFKGFMHSKTVVTQTAPVNKDIAGKQAKLLKITPIFPKVLS
jgi:hypothetical protein